MDAYQMIAKTPNINPQTALSPTGKSDPASQRLTQTQTEKHTPLTSRAINLVDLRSFRRHTLLKVNQALQADNIDSVNNIREKTAPILATRKVYVLEQLSDQRLIALIQKMDHISFEQAVKDEQNILEYIKKHPSPLDNAVIDLAQLSLMQATITGAYLTYRLAAEKPNKNTLKLLESFEKQTGLSFPDKLKLSLGKTTS